MTKPDGMDRPWQTPGHLWGILKPLAREMRHAPTPAEQGLWQALRNRQLGVRFRRQHSIGRFIVDFYAHEVRLVVEVDGPIHAYTPEEDAIRQEFLCQLGLRVVRFTNEQVLDSLNTVLEEISRILAEAASSFEK